MTNPVGSSSTSATAPTAASAATATASNTMDRNAFLKLLIAQISNQDPTNPMQGTEFVTQLSQFSLVEQAVNQSTQLGVLSTQMGGLSNNEAVQLVGKTVTIRGHNVAFDGTTATASNVTLASGAAHVTATVTDTAGHVVRTMDLGARQAGALSVHWDGRDDHGTTLPSGSYSVNVTATTSDNHAVIVTQDVTGVVSQVSFSNGYPEMVLDNGASAPISDLVTVGNGAPRTP